MLQIFIKNIYRTFIFPFKKVWLYFNKKVVFDIRAYADRKTTFEGYNSLGMESFVSDTCVGYGSYIADFSKIFNTKIGKYVSIGQGVYTAIGSHPTAENVSTSPTFFSQEPRNRLRCVDKQCFDEYKYVTDKNKYCIKIGNDVWIGNNVTILQGITIGDGAVIGAGAVVTRNVEPYAVYVGNPARKIRSRFSDEEISCLLEFKWWNKDIDWIKRNGYRFANVNDTIAMMNSGEDYNE